MIETLALWGELITAWSEPVGLGLLTLLTYLVWSIKSNHLPHIYSKLEELREDVVHVDARLTAHDMWERNGKKPQPRRKHKRRNISAKT